MTARPMPPLPRLPAAADPIAIKAWADQVVAALERQIQTMTTPVSGPWQMSNVAPSRALDPSAATLVQVAQVVGTLITDLQSARTIA